MPTLFDAGGPGEPVQVNFPAAEFESEAAMHARDEMEGDVPQMPRMAAGSFMGAPQAGLGIMRAMARMGLLPNRTRLMIVGDGGDYRGVILKIM